MPLDIITYNKLQKAIKDGNNLAGWTEESEQLNGKITEVDTRLTSELAQTPKKTEVRENTDIKPINVSEMDTETKQLFTGGAVAVVGENAVGKENIKEKAVIPKHLSFLESPINLFSGEYVRGFLSQVNGAYRSDPAGGSVAVVEIEPNKTYSVKLHDDTTTKRFVLSTMQSKPVFTETYSPIDRLVISDNDLREFTFTNDADGKYLLAYVSGIYDKPRLQIEEGDVFSEYDTGFHQLPTAYNGKLKVEIDDLKITKVDKSTLNTGRLIHPPGAINFNTVTGKITFGEGIELIIFWNHKTKPAKISIPAHEITAITPSYFINKYILFYRPSTNKIHYTKPENFYMTAEDVFLGTIRYGDTSEKIEVTGFENYYVDGKPDMSDVVSGGGKINNFLLLDNLNGIYNRPDGIVSMSVGEPTPLNGSSHTIIYGMYDSLVSKYPEYVTKTLLGNDSSGLPIYKYDFNPEIPENQTTFKFNKIKILVTSAIHGYEQLSAWSTAKFFEDLCDNHVEKEVLEFMRWNVYFSVIPVCNPYGYDANTRKNFNNVDLNRNFPENWKASDVADNYYGGESPASEPETQIIMQFLQDNLDAVYHIDHHNISSGYPLVYSGSQPETQISMNVLRTLTRKWRKDYTEAPATGSFGLVKSTGGRGTMTAYSRTLMNSTTLESAWMMPFASAKYDKITLESAVDLFGNFNVAILKSLT